MFLITPCHLSFLLHLRLLVLLLPIILTSFPPSSSSSAFAFSPPSDLISSDVSSFVNQMDLISITGACADLSMERHQQLHRMESRPPKDVSVNDAFTSSYNKNPTSQPGACEVLPALSSRGRIQKFCRIKSLSPPRKPGGKQLSSDVKKN